MTLVISDRVVETSTTTGTGALTLAGAVAGYQRFSAKMSVGDTCYYSIEAVDTNGTPTGDWETGIGTYSALNTLTRTTIKDSSNSGSVVTLAVGTKRVFLTLLAAELSSLASGGSGSLKGITHLSLGTNQSVAWAWDIVSWDTVVEDPLSAYSAGTPTQVTVPTGVTHVRVSGLLVGNSVGNPQYCYVENMTQGYILFAGNQPTVSGVWGMISLSTPLEQVTAGDVIKVFYNPGAASGQLLGGAADANIAHLNGTFGRPTRVVFEWIV